MVKCTFPYKISMRRFTQSEQFEIPLEAKPMLYIGFIYRHLSFKYVFSCFKVKTSKTVLYQMNSQFKDLGKLIYLFLRWINLINLTFYYYNIMKFVWAFFRVTFYMSYHISLVFSTVITLFTRFLNKG